MANGRWDWDPTTPLNNGSVDTAAGISVAENNTPPPAVNNAIRGVMQREAQALVEDGYPAAGGTADALTLTPGNAITSYAAPMRLTFTAGSNNATTSPTLNVSGVGGKALRKIVGGTDVALAAGDIQAAARYGVVYDSTANAAAGAWVIVAYSSNPLAFAGTFSGLLDLSGAAGGQVKFPATQNPSSNVNTLDDYEEGTFTPTLSFGGGNTGISTSSAAGTYTKIGCVVFFNLNIILTSKGSSAGAASIGALPFTSRNDGVVATPSFQGNNLASISGDVGGTISPNTTAVSLSYLGTGTNTSLTDANFTNTAIIRLSGFYFAA